MSQLRQRPAHSSVASDGSVNCFELEFLDQDGNSVRHEPLKARDFAAAIRAARFKAFCRGTFSHFATDDEMAQIDPLFAGEQTAPTQASAFHVRVRDSHGAESCSKFTTAYFASLAHRTRVALVRTEQIDGEVQLRYRLNAYLADVQQPAPSEGITLEPQSMDMPIKSVRRSDYCRVDTWDRAAAEDSDFRVLIRQQVLKEVVAEAGRYPALEIAGFLLGHLCRDPQSGEVFVVVTEFVSSTETTEASSTSVTLTPDSFAEVRRIIRLRDDGEQIIGWAHSHPFRFCDECPLPPPPECISKVLFFSIDDIQLMESTFPQPFMLGLLAAVEPRLEQALSHLPVRLFGYRDGQIQQFGFDVFRDDQQD